MAAPGQHCFAVAVVVFAVLLALHKRFWVIDATSSDRVLVEWSRSAAAPTVAAWTRQAQALFARGRAEEGATLLRMAAEHGGGNPRLFFLLAYLQEARPGRGEALLAWRNGRQSRGPTPAAAT